MPSKKPTKRPTIKDPVNDGKIYDPIGNVASDPKAKRKELVSELVDLLQGSVDSKVSGIEFRSKLDLVDNNLFELKAYVKGLKQACSSIVENYPNAENDQALEDLMNLCNVTTEGAERAEFYLSEAKSFGDDLHKIKTLMYTQLQILHSEV
jgi:hypothetical protein